MTEQGQRGAESDSDADPAPATVEGASSAGEVRAAPSARVVLVGLPGSGKSTIGRKLARELGLQLYDTDAGIEADTGRTIPDIFATDGEPEFRRIEEQVVRRAVLTHDGVVSLGGGSVLSARTRELLRDATVVYLEISVSEGVRRTGGANTRPLLNGVDPGAKYRDLMRERRPLYREIATVRVRTDGRSPGRVVRMILTKLGLESIRTDAEVARPSVGSATAPSGSAGGKAGTGSNRSKNRRRARARAAARRNGAEQVGAAPGERRGAAGTRNRSAAAPSGQDEAAAPQDSTRTGATPGTEPRGTRRSRRSRSRRGGSRIRATSGNAVTADGTRGQSERGGATGSAGNRRVRVAGRAENQGAERQADHRGAGRAGTSGAAPDRAASTRGATPPSGERAGPGGEPDRANTTNERRRRGQPRRRGGRRTSNDQKESEQRT